MTLDFLVESRGTLTWMALDVFGRLFLGFYGFHFLSSIKRPCCICVLLEVVHSFRATRVLVDVDQIQQGEGELAGYTPTFNNLLSKATLALQDPYGYRRGQVVAFVLASTKLRLFIYGRAIPCAPTSFDTAEQP
jgi:hypothetical protein